MNLRDPQPDSERVRPAKKKIYHKPGVQVYGTLAQMTTNQPGAAGHANDPSFQGPATPSNRRT